MLPTYPPKPKIDIEHWSGNQPDRIKAIIK